MVEAQYLTRLAFLRPRRIKKSIRPASIRALHFAPILHFSDLLREFRTESSESLIYGTKPCYRFVYPSFIMDAHEDHLEIIANS